METRIESLIAKTNGKAGWFETHKAIVAAERRAGLEWDGAANAHKAASPGKIVRAKTGSWGREIGGGKVAAMTGGECDAAGLKRGPAND